MRRAAAAISWLVLALGVLGYGASRAGAAEAAPSHVTTSYGYALYGDLKYPASFTHFDYANPDAPKGGIIHTTGLGSYDSFNGFALRGTSAINIVNFAMYYDTLMRAAANVTAQFYCLLCETVSYPDDFSWVEFRLRKNARWHDGKPITPQDVIFSFDMMKNHAAPTWANALAHVVKVEQSGPSTVRFYADAPNNRRLPMAVAGLVILPKHYWQGKDFAAPVTTPPLSSGPYEVSSYEFGRSYTLSRVKDYWAKDLPVNRGLYNYDTIITNYYRDTFADFEAFKAGYTDVRVEINPCQWKKGYTFPAFEHQQVLKGALNQKDAPLYEGFFFNLRKPEFQDPKLREGLSYAWDYTWVNDSLSCNQFVPLNSLFGNSELAASGSPAPEELALLEPYRKQLPPEVFGPAFQQSLTDGTPEGLRKNLRIGAQILQRAGYSFKDGKLISPKTGKPIEFEILIWDPNFQRAANAWINNLKLLGVTATIRSVDFPTYIKVMRNFDFQVLIGLLGSQLSPGDELRQIFSSSSADTPGSANWEGIRNPVIDALIEKIIAAKTRPELLAATRALDRVYMWNHYSIPVYGYPGHLNLAFWDRFGRPDTPPNAGYYFMTTWWIDPRKDAVVRLARGSTN